MRGRHGKQEMTGDRESQTRPTCQAVILSFYVIRGHLERLLE
jgi:hypothetical protein